MTSPAPMIADGLTAPVTPVSEAHADALRARGFRPVDETPPTPPDFDVDDVTPDADPGDD